MIDGLITPEVYDIDYLSPSAPYPATPSGITVHQKPIYRYSVPIDEQPVLSIVNFIPDYNGNFIQPGHYTLALSNDREFLYLIQSRELVAVIPVFKLAENKKELKKYYSKDKRTTRAEKKQLRKKEREDKIKSIIDAKYAKTGATPPKEYEHMEAHIEYIKEGRYYLLRYEKGFLRAWGAIKVKE